MTIDPRDLQWLRGLHTKSWKTRHDRNGDWPTDLPIHHRERRALIKVLEQNRDEFVFEPGSGVFGFGVSLNVYLPPTYPGTPPEHVISVTSKQMYPDDNCKQHDMYAFVESFTHTERNREVRAICGFKGKLHDMAYYDY